MTTTTNNNTVIDTGAPANDRAEAQATPQQAGKFRIGTENAPASRARPADQPAAEAPPPDRPSGSEAPAAAHPVARAPRLRGECDDRSLAKALHMFGIGAAALAVSGGKADSARYSPKAARRPTYDHISEVRPELPG